jgi:hypothetical protein
MRSFRLDTHSVAEVLDSWAAFVIAPVLVGVFAYFGLTHLWVRICAVLMCGLFGGYMLRGVTIRRFQEQYPGARHFWLLVVGQTSAVIGVAIMLAFAQRMGSWFDLTWLGITFLSILLFVIVNRKNKSVVR